MTNVYKSGRTLTERLSDFFLRGNTLKSEYFLREVKYIGVEKVFYTEYWISWRRYSWGTLVHKDLHYGPYTTKEEAMIFLEELYPARRYSDEIIHRQKVSWLD